MNIYIGNLSYDVTDSDLQSAFSTYGGVTSAKVVTDVDSGRSKGFGFVEMASKDEAQKAIQGLNGTELRGRAVNVNEARAKTDRSSGRGRRERF